MASMIMVVKILACGLCRRDDAKAPEEVFRVADSSAGQLAMRQHLREEHGMDIK